MRRFYIVLNVDLFSKNYVRRFFSLNKITYGIVKKRRIEPMRRFYIAENQAHCCDAFPKMADS